MPEKAVYDLLIPVLNVELPIIGLHSCCGAKKFVGEQVRGDVFAQPSVGLELIFLEDLASSSFAGLIGGDGATVAQFSLMGSRGAIEAMKACVEAQIGQGLAEMLAAGTGTGGANPF